MPTKLGLLIMTVLIGVAGCGQSEPTPLPSLTPTSPNPPPTLLPSPTPAPPDPSQTPSPLPPTPPPVEPTPQTPPPSAEPTPPADPFSLISQESLLAFTQDLSDIQPYSGWRNSASQGEAEALDYVAETLSEFGYLAGLGLELERQSFHVFVGTELRQTRLHLNLDGQEIEVPADGLRGPRDDLVQARRFDSDGTFNDGQPDPVTVEGPAVLIRSADEISALEPDDLAGKLVFVDYALIDRSIRDANEAVGAAWGLLEKGPAGLILVTQFSRQIGESHGAFVGDNSVLNRVETESPVPTLYVRLEDLAPAGIQSWQDLAQIEGARLTWDADVFAPADSGNLVARIPGVDPSRAIILGAHIDSPNGPGAMDDGSGSVVLLEVARVLNQAQTQPAVDLYLVWFGSEELGLYGASHFVATHQELLDRSLAMLQIDCLTRPLEGIDASLNLVTWSYGRLGDERLLWPDYLSQAAARREVQTVPENYYFVYSDNSTFGGFDVPHADLIYANEPAMEAAGGLHYASHIHSPYDTVELAREVSDVLEQMARVALIAALETGQAAPDLRAPPKPGHRALFVASHTEAVHMTPVGFTDLGMALAMQGFDVDLIPYGQAVTPADLADADLVVALPVHDYPSPEGEPAAYDEAWNQAEVAALQAYVAEGGLLVLGNSAHRLKYGNYGLDPNEDWADANALAERFGITYQEGTLYGTSAGVEGSHPLIRGVAYLELAQGNGLPFSLDQGLVLAQMEGAPVVALVDYGEAGGQVLALADVGILGASWGELTNLPFWQNLAEYAKR